MESIDAFSGFQLNLLAPGEAEDITSILTTITRQILKAKVCVDTNLLTFRQFSQHIDVQRYIHLICDTFIKISEISGISGLITSPCGNYLPTLLSVIENLQKSGMTVWQVLLRLTRDAGECNTAASAIQGLAMSFPTMLPLVDATKSTHDIYNLVFTHYANYVDRNKPLGSESDGMAPSLTLLIQSTQILEICLFHLVQEEGISSRKYEDDSDLKHIFLLTSRLLSEMYNTLPSFDDYATPLSDDLLILKRIVLVNI